MKMVMVTPYKLFEPRNSEMTYSVMVRDLIVSISRLNVFNVALLFVVSDEERARAPFDAQEAPDVGPGRDQDQQPAHVPQLLDHRR